MKTRLTLAAAAAVALLGAAPALAATTGAGTPADPPACSGVAAGTIHAVHETNEVLEPLHDTECTVAKVDPTSTEFLKP